MSEAVKQMENRLLLLEEQMAKLTAKELVVPDTTAKQMIQELLTQKKRDGVRELDAIDTHRELRLPFAQISMIMEQLEAAGVVHGKA